MVQEAARFRSPISFYVPAAVFGSLASAVILFFVILLREKSIGMALKFCVMTFLVVLPVMLVFIVIVSYTYIIEVQANGMYSYNPHNSWKREFIDWGSIHVAMRKNVFGLRYIFVLSNDGMRWLWIPSVIINKKDFLSILSDRLGNDNQLVQLLAGVGE